MRKVTITIYPFPELSDEAKQKAVEETRRSEWYLADEWWQWIYQEWKLKLEKLGYINPKIWFSGFSAQGDGACFEAEIDVHEWLKAHTLSNTYKSLSMQTAKNSSTLRLVQRGHYYHSRATDLDNDYVYDLSDNALTQLDEVENLIMVERKELGDGIYKALEKEYAWLISDEAIANFFINNSCNFLGDGSSTYSL